MKSQATTVAAYLDDLPTEKRALVEDLRALVLDNLPDGYVEAMNWGMIAYEIPLEVSGKTYNGKPLMYVAIGAQKNHVGLYLCGLYCVPGLLETFEAAYKEAGKKLDMGKACVRVKTADDLHRPAVAAAIAAVSVGEYVKASAR